MGGTPLFNWLGRRGAGVLLHPSCLPGDQGIGTFDRHLDRFLDFLQAAGMSYWQICPLGPTGYGDSPYQCFSAFAGNPYLIDLRDLVAKGLLTDAELVLVNKLSSDHVDFGGLYLTKPPLLKRAHERYVAQGLPAIGDESFDQFKTRQAGWLEPYAYFRALKDKHGGRPWTEWPDKCRSFKAAQKSVLRSKLGPEIEAHKFAQYVFFAQWKRVRAEAQRRGIRLIGDIPIFVAADSADVWSFPELFELDPETGAPLAVAGVPPDYFAADGQFWGNPLYLWDRHASDGYAWWKSRIKASFELVDVVRIDHFRGFDEYWRIPLPAVNARGGTWTQGPGLALFTSIASAFPEAKIIAEDLGLLSPSVVNLRDDAGLPGMAVLQFAFSGPDNLYLPHNLVPNGVIYPGTHDNDTTVGWYATADDKTKDFTRRYLRTSGQDISWDLIRTAYGSVSKLAVISLQDILGLGPEARFNTPGKPDGNWQWRFKDQQLEGLFASTAGYLRELGQLTARC